MFIIQKSNCFSEVFLQREVTIKLTVSQSMIILIIGYHSSQFTSRDRLNYYMYL